MLVVTGSNMSGKSTFLRTVGTNTVLALAGAPVRARALRLSPLAVGASIRVTDSLQDGESRFYAEIKRVRQVLDLARDAAPALFLMDEIFDGTNSAERRVGAEAVVRSLLGRGAHRPRDLARPGARRDRGQPRPARRERALRGPPGGRAHRLRLPAEAGPGPAGQRARR